MALTLGAQAQTATLMEGYGEPLTLDQFKALAGTGQRFGFVASSNTAGDTAPRCDHWCGFTSTHNTTTLSDDYLFYIEASDGNYLVKRVSDDQYVITNSGSTSFGASGTEFKLVNRDPNDATKAVTGAQSISFEDPSNSAMHYNANAVKMNNGPGAWTTYAVFGPIYKNITIDCQLNGTSMDGYPQTFDYKAGTVDAPEFAGSKLVDGQQTSVEISEDNQTITFNYESSSFDYTLVVNNAPEGTAISIKGNEVTAGTVSFEEEVAESDVVVAFPAGHDNWDYTVSISGTTITVNCIELWPVSFGEGTIIRIGEKVSSVTAATSPADNDHWYIITQVRNGESVTFARGENEKLRRGTTAQTAASFDKADATANGAYLVRFISTGENDLYKMQFGNAKFVDNGLKPSTTSIADAATYAFYNSNGGDGSYFGWNIDSKAGQKVDNNGAGNDVAFWGNGEVSGTSGNNIWYVYKTTIDVPAYSITYIVNDENGDELFRSGKIAADEGQVITELPAEYQRAAFYTYNTVNVTINGDNEAVFTATPREDAPVKYTADATNPIYYNLKIRGNYLVRKSDNTVPNQASSEPFNPAAAWAFIGTPYDGFSVINEQAGSDYTLMYSALYDANGNVFGRADIVTLRDDSGDKKWILETNTGGFVLRAKENTNVYLHQRSNNGLSTCAIVEWSAVHDDQGSTIIASTDKDALVELYNLLDGMEFGTGLNQYSEPADFANVMAAANTVITNDEIANFADTYQTLKALQASITLNMPQENTFLRIKSAATEKYISSTVDGSQSDKYATYYLGVENADNTTIWFYDGTHLLNYATGLYTNNCSAADLGTTGTEFTFSEAPGVLGKYNIKPGSQNYWYAGNPTIDNYSDNTHANTRFTLEYVDELPVTMNDGLDGKYYATFSAPVAISSITGATAHKVKVENEKAKYSETGVEGIPAGTGVLLINETGDDAMLTIGDFTDAIDTDLRSITAAVSSHEGLFFGLSTENKLGFFKLMEEGGETTPTTGGFKAYLDGAVTPTGAKGVELVADNEATGVEAIDNSEFAIDNAPVYNLQGQRVNKAQKGVFIQNGKKVVVR